MNRIEAIALVVAVMISLLLHASATRPLALRITALEQAAPRDSFNGFLYVLNESGTWDRIRANQLDVCRTRRCSVIAVVNGADCQWFTPAPQSKP